MPLRFYINDVMFTIQFCNLFLIISNKILNFRFDFNLFVIGHYLVDFNRKWFYIFFLIPK